MEGVKDSSGLYEVERRAAGSPPWDKRAVNSRDALAAKMTPAQIVEAQRLAREWKPKE
jgi:hypothetical protein